MPDRNQNLLTGDEFADLLRIINRIREDLNTVRQQVESNTVIIESNTVVTQSNTGGV